MARIELSIYIAAPRQRCFDLARSVEAHMHTTSSSGERAVGGKTSGLLDEGDHVAWRARHFGVWQTLSGRISAFDPPRHFRDTMTRGAFKRIDHDHFFEDAGGGTVMRDVFDYEAPFGVLGRIAERLFLTAYMRRFLEARNRELKALAESDEWMPYLLPD